jgi:hypothetical protein
MAYRVVVRAVSFERQGIRRRAISSAGRFRTSYAGCRGNSQWIAQGVFDRIPAKKVELL